MTQSQFADALCVSPRSYHHYERGSRMVPTDVLIRLHDQFEIRTEWILYGEGQPSHGPEGEELGAFISEVIARIDRLGEGEPRVRREDIVRRWIQSLLGGGKVGLVDIENWARSPE